MCRSIAFLAATSGVLLVANVAPAQGTSRIQGRFILVPPSGDDSRYGGQYTPDAYGRTGNRTSPNWYDTVPGQSAGDYGRYSGRYGDYDSSYYDRDRHDHARHDHHDHGGVDSHSSHLGPVRYRDPRLRQVANWYSQLLGRPLKPSEAQNWQNHLAQGRPGQQEELMEGILATILGSDEYYQRVGSRFDAWTSSVERATSRPISREEAADWSREYRRARDRVQVRIGLVRHLLEEHRQEPIVVPEYDYDHSRYGDRYGDRDRYRDYPEVRRREIRFRDNRRPDDDD